MADSIALHMTKLKNSQIKRLTEAITCSQQVPANITGTSAESLPRVLGNKGTGVFIFREQRI